MYAAGGEASCEAFEAGDCSRNKSVADQSLLYDQGIN